MTFTQHFRNIFVTIDLTLTNPNPTLTNPTRPYPTLTDPNQP